MPKKMKGTQIACDIERGGEGEGKKRGRGGEEKGMEKRVSAVRRAGGRSRGAGV